MSLHAKLSPEAQARLDAQRRNSTISSVAISLLTVALVGLVLALIFIPSFTRTKTGLIAYTAPEPEDPPREKPKLHPAIQRKPAAPSSARTRVLAVPARSSVAIPVCNMRAEEPSPDFGDGDDFGQGGIADGPGLPGETGIPRSLSKRCSQADRMERLLANGGTERCEEAVVKGLDWLQRTQHKNGSWGASNKSAMTGLALLAYLGHCETPRSEKYSDTVFRAIVYLVDLGMKNNGKLVPKGGENEKHWPYQHAIATYALAEATTFCKTMDSMIPNLADVTQQAGQYIIDNQHKTGGWDYGYSENSARGGDLSVTGWHIQALKACQHTGLDFRNMRPCIRKALAYTESHQNSRGGFGYTGKNPAGNLGYDTLTGVGVLSFQMWDRGSVSAVRKGAKYIEKFTKFDYDAEFCDLYAHYYESQAMMNRGGAQWRKYNALFRDQLLDNQNADGSWKTPGGGKKPRAVAPQFVQDTHYRTCLCILMLEVYYRFLPGTGEGTR